MRILLASAASLAALTAAPAMAQSAPYPSYGYNNGYARPAVPSPWQIRSMISDAERNGEISRDSARELRDEADDLVRLDRRSQDYSGDMDARREINRRSFRLLAELRRARGEGGYGYNAPRYGSGYGNGSGYRPPEGDYRQPQPGYRAAPGGADPDAAPPSEDGYDAPPPDNRYAPPPPPSDNRYAPPPPQDDQRYAPDNNDPGEDDGAPPPDDGNYPPRNN